MLRTELEHCKENLTLHHKIYRDKLLIPDHPLQVLPRLAVKIGLNEAVILQQVHYWICNPLNQNIRDGRVWVYNTYGQWKDQFPFWSYETIKRAINSLEVNKLLISGEFNKAPTDRTKWYTIDYEQLKRLEVMDTPTISEATQIKTSEQSKMHSSSRAKCTPRAEQNALLEQSKMHSSSITETTTETTAESIKRSLGQIIKKSFGAEFDEFWSMYPKKVDKHKCSKIYQGLLVKGGISLHETVIHSLAGQNRERELNDELGEWQALPKNPQTWLNGRCWEDKFKTEEQLREEHQRSVSKSTNQPRRLSKIDQQHSLNAQLRESAARELQDINDRRAEIAREIARREGSEGDSGREHSYQSL